MRTFNTKYLFSIFFVFALIIGLFFSSVAVLAEHENFPFEIRSTYTYEKYNSGANSADTIGNCQPGEAFENLVIREERVQRYPDGSQPDFQLQDVIYCLSGQSLYTFNTFANDSFIDIFGDEILVVGATPEEGKKYDATGDIHGIEGTITIANTGLFNSTFPDAATDGADSATAETINNIEDAEADETEEPENCEERGGVLGFIMCAVIEMFDGLLYLVDSIIIGQLTIDPDRYNNEEMRTAASVIRNISYVILIPILLVMVIGTALNFSFVDAYTVKRAMPRMLVAIIFITLSWPLLVLMVEATEVIAAGLNGLITSPFREGSSDLSMQEIFGPGLLTNIVALPFVVAGLIVLLVLFGGTLAGVAAIGFLILLARQIFIVALMLFAPLAILSWIFPGNDKLWKAWWTSFSRLLIMYPLIVVILAMGRVFAVVIHPSGESGIGNVASNEILEPITAFIVYFLPYAFIPFAFRTAGGIFSTVTGSLNDRSKGFFDKQRQKRQKTSTDFMAGASENKVLRGTGLNRLGRRLGGGATLGMGDRGRARMTQRFDVVSGKNAKENEKLQNLALHDDEGNAVMALGGRSRGEAINARNKLTQMHSDNEIRKEAEAAGLTEAQFRATNGARVAQIQNDQAARFDRAFQAAQAVGFSRSNQRAALQLLGQNKARAILPGQESVDALRQASDSLYMGDSTAQGQGRGEAAYFMRSGNRFDLGDSALSSVGGGIKKAGLYQLANGETPSIKAWGEEIMSSGDEHKKTVHLEELKAMQPNTLGANRDEVNRQIKLLESDPGLQTHVAQKTGSMRVVEDRVPYNRQRAATDPAYASKFTPDEITRGFKYESRTVHETLGDLARKEARAYERPDPNRLES